MQLRDWTFEKFFRSAYVYNILFEDTEVDETILGVDEDSSVLAISGAGCGVANHISRHATRVDAVDINPHHLALTALKSAGAQHLDSWSEFYTLFGHGHHPDAEKIVRDLSQELPKWMQAFWRVRWRMFNKSMVRSGMTAQMLTLFRKLTGIDANWLRARIGETREQRVQAVEWAFKEIRRRRWVLAGLESPIQLIALGVNYEQRDKMLAEESVMEMVDFFENHMKRLADTDLERNWYAWYAAAGHFNHDLDDSVPPYLRRDHFERSRESGTQMRYHNKNIFDLLGNAGPDTWTHYTLCDAVDWMPGAVQQELFREIFRTARSGAKVLYRSVEDRSLMELHGLEDRFIMDREQSDWASASDRSKQYRRVNVYTVAN
ncbi:hypothetical protein PPSIR1_01427 [Plesiocystis pacifica SIR-1]|uniref:S-adenosylmethionine:diacylglycerol 3-amino-3-carboxypropyl transferase n=1 Tax=Plesiocystis pacifica SIR-1 TaxID=391625 RepID=A6G8D6_9BACT|nr:DUF3419 family protein [Plesiocystis pacifica]EDM77846.1 hypothetical protein PPSIR1_01427 [Plesiocystis pacifica SIR-1]